MQNLRFRRIRICSEKEQKALTIPLHQRKTLFLGSNSTGKSTIIKSLFRAFDAEPTGDLRGWDYDAIIAVDFSVDGRDYMSVRKGDLKALFCGQQLIGATTTSTEWNDLFAEAVGFKLQLMDRDERFRTATPSMFFMPFYINQDGSFFSKWDTFKGVQQFDANAIPHSLEYFAHVRPIRYFEIKGHERTTKSKLAELEVEASTLQRTRLRLRRTLRASPVKLTAAGFEKEVHELARQATELGAKQDKLRIDIVESQELARQLADQIRLSNAALREHEADFKSVGFATSEQEGFRCPTCHAEHDASFHTFLGLAEDARELYRMKELMQRNLSTVNDKLFRLRREATTLKQRYLDVSNLLNAKRGRLTFEDVVKSYGVDAADTALDGELTITQKHIGLVAQQLRDMKLELAAVIKAHNPDEPMKLFRESFKDLLAIADVPSFPDVDLWKLNKRPTDSGSPGPRAVVAYYGALWSAMQDETGELPSPLVIDSPNQNAQDRKNLERVMALLAGKTPANAQVILCAEEASEAFSADMVITLEDERALLKSDLMESVATEILPFVEVALAKLGSVIK
jgi:hypothetical protein